MPVSRHYGRRPGTGRKRRPLDPRPIRGTDQRKTCRPICPVETQPEPPRENIIMLTSKDPFPPAINPDSATGGQVVAPMTGARKSVLVDYGTLDGSPSAPPPPPDATPRDDGTATGGGYRVPGQPSAAESAQQRLVTNSPKTKGQQLAQQWRDDPSTHPANQMPGSSGRSFSL